MALLIYKTEDINGSDATITLFHFVSAERDPITGLRHWVDRLGDAKRYVETYEAEQDQLLYGGVVASDHEIRRLDMDAWAQTYSVAGYTRPVDPGWVRLEPSPAPLELGL